MDFYEFFETAKAYVEKSFSDELKMVDERTFDDVDTEYFLEQYVYVVLNVGMRNQVAERMFLRWLADGYPSVNHPAKQKAIRQMENAYKRHFESLKSADNKLGYIATLPFMGEITKYHLARNLGLDFVKPDRHLTRLASRFGFKDAQTMCKDLADRYKLRLGTVDIILWRYANMHSGESKN